MDHGRGIVLTGIVGQIFYLEQGPMLHLTFKNLQLLGAIPSKSEQDLHQKSLPLWQPALLISKNLPIWL